ncbi:DUF4880 domain-containing protein [Reyranella sp. CPCC 100927]|nr:DUF4880 domain-containing protein [Reyranella sp. CPCC 100927]
MDARMAPSTPDNSNDPAWDEALDWLLKVKAAPGDAGLQADLARWLSQRETHATAYRRAERIWGLMGEVPPHTARRRHQSPTEAKPDSKAMARRSRWSGVVSLAASIVLVCILAFYAPTLWQSFQADYSTAVAETRQVTLSDGSVVSLNANSAIALHYSKHRRDVTLLRGEAFFVVADRDPRQFSVQADGMTVVDLGTSFNVNLGSTSLDVAVHSGVVEVHYKGGAGPGSTRLTTGEQLMVDRATGQTTRGVSSPSSMAAWRTGSIIVRGATIAQVVDQVRRHYRGIVLVTDDRFAARKITGIYDLADPVAALRAAVEPHAGKVTRITPFLVVVSGP